VPDRLQSRGRLSAGSSLALPPVCGRRGWHPVDHGVRDRRNTYWSV